MYVVKVPRRKKPEPRRPLSRDRVLDAALALADAEGLDALSMRKLGQALGVEAMSLYNHVTNKDEVLDGMVDRVMGEIAMPTHLPWRDALCERCLSAHAVLLRHPWAAALIESRVGPGPLRLAHHDALIGVLRAAGFSLGLTYRAVLTLDSYVYGFVLQEVNWPFTRAERPEVVASIAPHVDIVDFPHLVEMMGFITDDSRQARAADDPRGPYGAEFTFGLELILDGIEAMRSNT